MTRRVRHGMPAGLALLTALSPAGCVANSSNPAVAIRAARMDERHASFDLALTNPGGRDLVVTALRYDVCHGESSFPIASGEWRGDVPLPAHGEASLHLDTTLDMPPIEPDSRRLELSGDLSFTDRTGFLGLHSMDLTRTTFRVEAVAEVDRP